MLKKNNKKLSNKSKCLLLFFFSVWGDVLASCEHQNMQGGQIGSWRTICVSAMFTQKPHTIKVENLKWNTPEKTGAVNIDNAKLATPLQPTDQLLRHIEKCRFIWPMEKFPILVKFMLPTVSVGCFYWCLPFHVLLMSFSFTADDGYCICVRNIQLYLFHCLLKGFIPILNIYIQPDKQYLLFFIEIYQVLIRR